MFRLVIADDDEILLKGLSSAFDWAELGIEVAASALDGEKALQAVREKNADILLTDIKMGNMDGLRLTELLYQEKRDVSIVIMSAYDEFQFAQQALRMNVEDYLLKPLDLEHLKEVMFKVVQKRARQRKKQEQMDRTYENLKKMENYRYLEGQKAEPYEQDLEKYYNTNHALNKSLIEYLARLVFLGDKGALSDYTGRLKENLRHVGNNSKIMLFFALSLFWGELNKNGMKAEISMDQVQDQYNDYYKKIAEKETLDEAMVCFEKMILEISDRVNRKESLSNEELVESAKAMIEREFSNPELRLGDVAARVNLSPNYFSTIFKEITGQGFAEYLMERRMKEAQHLIVTTKMRSGEVAARVGYDNPTYFSSIFKKYSGMTVSQYRSMIRP